MNRIKHVIASLKLKSVFAERRHKLYSIAYAWSHDAALADDLVQETIYKALKKSASLQDVATVDAWLYRILFNCWHDYLRTKGRHVELFDKEDEKMEHVELYQQAQIIKRVRASVQQLPLPLREVVTLADFSGCSYAQIADIVEIPVGTVMSRLFRARKLLKESLLEFGNDVQPQTVLRRVK